MTKMERSSKKRKMENNEGGGFHELKKGLWTKEEDQKLLSYIQQFGHGCWRSLSAKAGLNRCGKSCRLRWNNYLRPDIEKGRFTLEEERTIIQLHALLGNRWSSIAAHLPRRTDSMIKNHWNAHIKKRLVKMGIDPMTHKPKVGTHLNGSNLSHMTQWEAARLEAEARLAQQPKHYHYQQPYFVSPPSTHKIPKRPTIPYSQCLDVLNVWQGTIRSKYLINGGLQTPNSTPSTPMINYDESKGSSYQEMNSILHDKSEIVIHPFEEFGYPHDAKFIIDDPLTKPSDYLGICVGLLTSGTENHEGNNDG